MSADKTQIKYDPQLVGLARVSTEEQNVDMQVAALERAGVDPANIVIEYGSGAAQRRPKRDLAAKRCRAGMTLVVWKLDRVGRSLMDVYAFVKSLEKRNIGLRSLTEYLDTKTPIGRLAFAMLASFAEFERDQIADRTKTGIARAKERGATFGQPAKFTDHQAAEIKRLFDGGMSYSQLAKKFDCSPATIKNYISGRSVPRKT